MESPAKILIVHPEVAVAEALATRLRERRPYQTTVALSVDEACDAARHRDFDLILIAGLFLDDATCRRLSTARPEAWTPIIGLVENDNDLHVTQALESGCDEYLTTPVDDFALHARVRSMLRIKALQDAIAERQLLAAPPATDDVAQSSLRDAGPESDQPLPELELPASRWQRLRALFDEAVERSPDQRHAFVENSCGSDVLLRQELEGLLTSHDQNGPFLETPAIAGLSISDVSRDDTVLPIPPNTSLGPYRIEALLGTGAMGEVYRACDVRLGRQVAIKVLPARFAAEPDRVRRFEREARAAAALNHPNILAIYFFGILSADAPDLEGRQGSPFIVSELLNGASLQSRLNTPIPTSTAIEWALQTLRGLGAAHANGIVHRDLKPENLFVTASERLKILDFGLAKLLRPSEEFAEGAVATAPGMILGTPGYMAPEQLYGEPADHRADIFSFGAIFYEMLSGTRVLPVDTVAAARRAMRHPSWPDLSRSESPLSDAHARIIRRCLEQQPKDRFQSVEEVASEIAIRG